MAAPMTLGPRLYKDFYADVTSAQIEVGAV